MPTLVWQCPHCKEFIAGFFRQDEGCKSLICVGHSTLGRAYTVVEDPIGCLYCRRNSSNCELDSIMVPARTPAEHDPEITVRKLDSQLVSKLRDLIS